MEKILFTSESVTEGHPDKVCDSISDAILDAMMAQDPMSRVACETATTTGLVLVMGEITTKANVDIQKIVRDTIREIGYDNADYGFPLNGENRHLYWFLLIILPNSGSREYPKPLPVPVL